MSYVYVEKIAFCYCCCCFFCLFISHVVHRYHILLSLLILLLGFVNEKSSFSVQLHDDRKSDTSISEFRWILLGKKKNFFFVVSSNKKVSLFHSIEIYIYFAAFSTWFEHVHVKHYKVASHNATHNIINTKCEWTIDTFE